jgi:NAD(P)-dependent dehydrogenase (short-subunit alcohol dehydrogenase family)
LVSLSLGLDPCRVIAKNDMSNLSKRKSTGMGNDIQPPSGNYKAALVTGAARRLGREMALGLARRGIDIALHYNSNDAEAENTAQDIRALGVKCVTLQANLLIEDDMQGLVDRARVGLGQDLDVLINSASVFKYDSIKSASKSSWDMNIDSNLRAPFVLSQNFANQAPPAGRQDDGEMQAKACIVNMIDQRVRKLTKEYMTYTIGKMGLWAFTQTSARALGPHVRVNGIGPGSTMQGAEQSDEQFREHRQGAPLQRGANPEDIVQAMNFLLDAHAFTGQLLCVDGGMHL